MLSLKTYLKQADQEDRDDQVVPEGLLVPLILSDQCLPLDPKSHIDDDEPNRTKMMCIRISHQYSSPVCLFFPVAQWVLCFLRCRTLLLGPFLPEQRSHTCMCQRSSWYLAGTLIRTHFLTFWPSIPASPIEP